MAMTLVARTAGLQPAQIEITPEHPTKGRIMPAGCRVVLIDDRAELHVRPCAPFTLAAGRYTAWLESDDFISREAWELTAAGTSLRHQSTIVPAGSVRVDAPALDEAFTVRVFALDASTNAFRRTVRPNEPVLMPAGQVVAIATDPRGRVVAVSSQERLPAGMDRTLAFVATRRILAARAETPGEPASFSLSLDGRFAPTVFVHQERVGVWYDLTEPSAVLGVDSPTLGMPPFQVRLARTGVTYVPLTLHQKPSLAVTVGGDAEVLESARPIRVVIIDDATEERLGEATLVDRQHVFLHLDARLVRCVLEAEGVTRTETADLTTFSNAEVRFELDPIRVDGSVTLGGTPARASITFRRDTAIRADTDAEGRYTATLWEEGKHSAEVRIEGVAPHRDMIDAYGEAVTIDFRVPKPTLALRIIDDGTGEPIRKASVSIRNAWTDEEVGSRALVQTVFSDEKGEVTLPGFRPGGVDVYVNASGYHAAKPLRLTADERDEWHRLEVRLQALQGTRVQLRLPNGSPAAGARVLMIRPDGQRSGATADDNGVLTIPDGYSDCLLVIKDAGFAHAQRRVAGQDTVVLARKGSTLHVKVQDPAGKPIPFAAIAVWIDGIPLAGVDIAFLSDGFTGADSTGLWTASNVPAVALRIAAHRPGAATSLPALQAVSRLVQPPWPPMVTVTAD